MPALPFTFEDAVNAKHPSDLMKKSSADGQAQDFLTSRIEDIKGRMNVEGAIDVGLAMNPVTRIVDMGSKFFGGPGIHKGFEQGVNMTGETRVPPMMF